MRLLKTISAVSPMRAADLSKGGWRLAVCGFFVLLALFAPSNGHADTPRDLVVVLDISTSMFDIFDQAKAQAKQFISSAQLGDRVTIITFGKTSHLLERARIRSSYDIARALSKVERLEPTEFGTNLPSGMKHGLEEMQRFYEEAPDAERILLWLSDGKDNPPKDIPNLITFETLKKRKEGQLPDTNWFVFEAPIQPEVVSDVEWFVDWARRTQMKLTVVPLSNDTGMLYTSEPHGDLTVRFEPDHPGVWGTSFSVVAEVSSQDGDSYSATVPLTPPVIVCADRPWEQTFRVTFPDRPGDYVCRISFVLPSDKMLEITPPQIAVSGSVQEEMKTIARHVASIEETFERDHEQYLQKRAQSQTALGAELREELEEMARLSEDRPSLLFGPIVAGGHYTETARLYPTGNVPLDSIYMETHFRLPAELELEPTFRIEDGTLVADIRVVAGANPMFEDGCDIRGMVSFHSKEKGVEIKPDRIPARFYSKAVRTRWGRREIEMPAAYGSMASAVNICKRYIAIMLKVLILALFIGALFYVFKRYRSSPSKLVGRLELIRAPAGRKLRSFELSQIGRTKASDSLIVGSNGEADILLLHPSVAHSHAKITTAQTDAGAVIFIEPLNESEVLINGAACTRQKELADQDQVKIGDFVLLYGRPDMNRETLVEFIDGTVMRGTLVSWDIDAPTFAFLPWGTSSRKVIDFSELKSVSFIRKSGALSRWNLFVREKSPTGRQVEIIFSDGELLDGYLVGDSNEWSKRFYVIPKEKKEVALVLVERSAVQDVASGGFAFGLP